MMKMKMMGIIGEKLDIDFVISTGDNFYESGLNGVDDPAFQESFTNIYTAPSLQKPWYTVLGNHDYRGDVEAQLSPVLRKLDSKWICMRSFIVDTEIAEFFFVDTTPFVDKYFLEPKDDVYDWDAILPRKHYLSNLLKDVDSALKESSAKWKIVENNVDVYMNGHDHCLQHITSMERIKMGIIGEKLEIEFVISTGDNFYEDGLTGVNDTAFYESFSNIYTAPTLQKQWYIVLGNHDYRGNALAQLSPVLKKKDRRWLCLRSFIVQAEIVDIFFVDTTPFVDKYFTNPGDQTYDWRGVSPRTSYISKQLKWKIVVGHHTIKSAGHHGNTEELESQLLPVLEANNVDFYVNGHDHCLEHIVDTKSQIQFLTSGGGSKAWRGDIKEWNQEELKLYYDGQGFMSMEITETVANFSFYDIFGNVLHKDSLYKNLHSSM
ncbi:hypothetical protein G4B88_020981 [Cannabis sativa]|uniref:acid phosphatase n=1 Tax=Cannabis sativa TaxID=3483 RepID=A0A7J6DPE9_CANSA|nr:hypothetical protein G4B88_020981 [Cannabis sativa]